MLEEVKWLSDALATKDIVIAMSHYRLGDGMISATDGRISAGYPWEYPGRCLVPGGEFKAILARMPGEPDITHEGNILTVKHGRFRGAINTLPLDQWTTPGIDPKRWRPLAPRIIDLMVILRPFISDNATKPWATCIGFRDGWMFSTNNVSLAAAKVPELAKLTAMLPSWAIDFVLDRRQGLIEWAWDVNHVGFRWENGAWMRSQLVAESFPDSAIELAQQAWAEQPTQPITDNFRSMINRIVGMGDEPIKIYATRTETRFGKAEVSEAIRSEIPKDHDHSTWNGKYLIKVINAATHWQPGRYPKPVPWRGPDAAGLIMGITG